MQAFREKGHPVSINVCINGSIIGIIIVNIMAGIKVSIQANIMDSIMGSMEVSIIVSIKMSMDNSSPTFGTRLSSSLVIVSHYTLFSEWWLYPPQQNTYNHIAHIT